MKLEAKDITPQIVKEMKAEQKQEFKFIGTIKPIKGLTLFAYNIKTQELRIVEIQKNTIVNFDKTSSTNSKAFINPNEDIIIQALNFNNAKKKIIKMYKLVKVWKEKI